MGRMNRYTFIIVCLMGTLSLAIAPPTQAEIIVRFQTVLGDVDVELFEDTTPLTVANFLDRVKAGDYTNTIFHRSAVPATSGVRVVQGGGFAYNGSLPLDNVPTKSSVLNEPGHSNVRGTIAMAKQGGDPNSATNQWYFNVDDNLTLDDPNLNGGFTVFGKVLGDGMNIIDAIATLPRFNFGGALNELPLRNFANTGDLPNSGNFVIVNNIEIIPEPTSLAILTLGCLILKRRAA